jgi:hypothetical protein
MTASVYVPQILSIPPETAQPIWSVMIPTYNCAAYLQQTLESVLIQDPGPQLMQIQVVDDCSTKDNPEAVVQAVGKGRVEFFRQLKNVGAINNFNTCIQRSVGKLVHILHGDDFVQADFYHKLQQPLLDQPEVGAAFCRQLFVDEQSQSLVTTRLEQPISGIFANAVETLAISNRIQPPAIVVKRVVYEALGGYDLRLFHAADWEMWVRIAARYPIWYETTPLAAYRIHTASHTSGLFQSGANIQNRRQCIQICQPYLPPAQADILRRKALGYSIFYALALAYQFLKHRQARLSLVQVREALVCLWQMVFPDYYNPASL